ncbi:hypothetical protein KSS87_000519 [Heliosperma pusillum]|nr:hypothetical protein KSS87_000519 [Heliosperma pusillum]
MGELREVEALEGHGDRVWGLAWNPTAAVLASCSGDKTVRIWEQSPSGSFICKAILEDTHTRTVRSCAWSPSGKMLATASFDATTAVWENIGGDYECVSTLEGHENEVKSVSWNAAGSLIATCGRDKSVWIWEVEPGNEFECVSVLQGHTQDVKMIQWHPSVDVLFSCSYDNSIKIWAEDGDDDWHCVQTLNEASNGHTSTVWAMSFNAAGDKMVSCSDDLTIKVWGTDNLHSDDGFSPWDGVIATGAADDAIRLFVENDDGSVDGPMYKLLSKREKAHEQDVNSVQWSSADTEAISRLLRTFSQSHNISAVKHLHAQLTRSLLHTSNYVNNHLLLSYVNCGRIDYAQKLFDHMPQRNMVSWTAMITAFSRQSLLANAVAVFSQMRHVGESPNEFAFSSVIQAATRVVGFGRQVHCLAVKSGFGNELVVGSNLADMYSKCACIRDACKVFEEMPYKDHVSWTSMIDGYAKHGFFKEALLGFKRMLLEGVVIDSYVISSAVSASASMKACTFGWCVHCITVKLGLEEETAVGNALVDMYSKVNDMESAARVFGSVSRRMNVVSYTSLIDGYVESDQIEKALETFVELTRKGMVPNEFTFSSLVKACANHAALEQGSQLHAQVVKFNFVADAVVSSALVYMYGKCGLVGVSAQLFHCIENPADYAWNSLMSGFSHNGLGKEAVKTFETMIQQCVKPNAITFVNLIMGCSHAGLVEEGLTYFKSMESKYGVAPSAEHYSCVIDLFSRAGKLREADDFINRMPFEPDCFGWCSYLGACRMQGDKARAEIAAEKLMRLEPENSSAHVMLSSIYAKERQWADVRSLRKMMKDGNLKKLPGYSWVDVGYKTHVFGAHDWSHPQQAQIYTKLDSLINEIKRMGYKPERDVIHIDADDSTKEKMLQYHSEKIAVAFAVMSLPSWKPIIIKKNLRICIDCHSAIKLMAKAVGRSIIVRDNSRFHHFADGYCSCNDFW